MEELSKEELEKRLKWYSKKYGSYVEKKGFHNWKNLFRRPNNYEWTILFMLFIVVIVIPATYNRDFSKCREFAQNLDSMACELCTAQKTDFSDKMLEKERDFPQLNLTMEVVPNG